jgi:DNA-directed RNA polymerase sigma subunit (sigma70/sigma32)
MATMLALVEPDSEPRQEVGPVEAIKLVAEIEHHRNESRRLARAANEHRAKLRELLRQRDAHISGLRASGWSLARIGSLYKVTKERVGQITAAIRPTGDEARAA